MSEGPHAQTPPPVEVNLTAAIVALAEDEPLIIAKDRRGAHDTALPSGPFNPLAHRTFEIGLLRALKREK